jgi:hypothetical protein
MYSKNILRLANLKLLHKLLFQSAFIFVLFILFIFTPHAAHAASATPSAILTPNGGETYTVGDPVQIKWTNPTSVACSLYYITPEGGPTNFYYIGSVSDGSSGTYDWTASVPDSTMTSGQQEKIILICTGSEYVYSDNYFTVNPLNTVTCDKKAEVSFVDTSIPAIYPGQSVTNQFIVKNPNDPSCGGRFYGLSQSYPGGWSMDTQYSVYVPGGASVAVPVTLTSSNTASYQTYSYSMFAGDFSGGVLQEAKSYVTVVPRCDATVQASLQSSSNSVAAGGTVANGLVLTNPNPAECGAKSYIYSIGYPSGWSIGIQQNVSVTSGQTITVPFTVGVASSAQVGTYSYNMTVYNAWYDGSGQAAVSGTVKVLDTIAPSVTITSPTGTTVPKRSTVTFTASASDDVAVTKVEYYVNSNLVCTNTTSGCSFNAVVKKGTVYNLSVKAYDAAGNVGSVSKSVTTQ